MKILRTPIEELIKYVEDLYRNQNKEIHDDIISLIDEYHCKFSKYHTIIPLGYEIMEDCCDGNWHNTMENCPNIPGIIVTTPTCSIVPSMKAPIRYLFSNRPTLNIDSSLFMLKPWTSSSRLSDTNAIVLPYF